MNGKVWSWRNLALYVPVVLCSYGLAGATIDAMTGTRGDAGFFASSSSRAQPNPRNGGLSNS